MASANIFGGLADGALIGLAAALLLLLNGRIARESRVFSPADSAIDDRHIVVPRIFNAVRTQQC
jgi:hypothetical protein